MTEAQQRGTGLAYMSAFFRAYVGGESQFIPILTGDAPPPASAQTNNLFVSYHAPDIPGIRLDVNRLLTDSNLSVNFLGGAVTPTALTPYDLCGGEAPPANKCIPEALNAQQPHTTPSARSTARGMTQLRTGWNDLTGNYRNNIPPALGNVSGFQAIQFRVSVNFADARNLAGLAQDFRVVLTDASGASASVRVSDVSGALYFPPGDTGPVPKVVLNTVRVPLSAFGGVNLNAVRSVQFAFNERLQGGLLITDVAFASSPQ
nr:secreted protein [uncultured bacterium]